MKKPLLFLALAATLAQCRPSDPEPGRPEDLLPPATQTGQRTFGCVLNGQPWTPRGSDGTANYSVVVDPTYHGGNMSIGAYRYTGGLFQSIILGGDSIHNVGTYSLANNSKAVIFKDLHLASACQEIVSRLDYHRGTLVITRYDLQAGIVSGTFEFTMVHAGCDTVRVTHGRFDYKL